ncbi:MAG: HEAT repeat domain-containing protein [Gemmatimonadaceae bacterium]
MTLPTATSSAGAGEPQELPFPPGPIEDLLRTFVKAVRAHQLYPSNSPVYKAAVDSVRTAFAPVWRQTDELALKFSETEIKWFGHPVLTEATKSGDSLPWTFFKDGLRELQLTPGFEGEELVELFEILQRIRKASPDEDDLLTLLWQADFANLRYRYVDVGGDTGGTLADGSRKPELGTPGQVMSRAHEESEQAVNAVVNMQDFDATLYFLDEKELDYLRQEIEREYASDLRQNVIAILFDIYEAQSAPAIREEVSELIETLMLLLLAAGQLRSVAYLLSETQVIAKRVTNMTPQQVDRLGKLPERLSAAEPLSQLLQGLDESADLPPQTELIALFEQLRAGALETVLATLPRLQNPKVRPRVEQAANRLAGANTFELAKLVLSKNRDVALEALRRAGAMKTAAAVVPMAKVLADSNDVQVRQVAAQALSDIGSPGALQALEKSIEDSDRDVRVSAVRTLGAKAFRGVFQRLESAVKAKAIRERDLTEKMAFFEAYGALCGDGGVAYLDEILNGKSMLGRREDPELRACAAIALGRIATKKATDSLKLAANEKDIVVRNAVTRALRGGTGGSGNTGPLRNTGPLTR